MPFNYQRYGSYTGSDIASAEKTGRFDMEQSRLIGDALYQFSSHTFTTAGNDISRNGPSYAEATTAYSSATWTGNSDFFNVVNGGVQLWKAPASGNYNITAAGSRGGTGKTSYGFGRIVSGTCALSKGDVLAIIVGAQGNDRGGGGGSFVWFWDAAISSSTPGTQNLIICGGGGGGGGGYPSTGGQADSTAPQSESAVPWFALTPTSVAYTNSPPTAGEAGEQRDNTANYWDACPGAGWNSDAVVQQGGNTPAGYFTTWGVVSGDYTSTVMSALSPKSTVSPGRGGIAWYNSAGGNADGNGAGGFGGGGSQGGDAAATSGTGGGGGGYSGGCQGGNNSASSTGGRAQGGGAGSYLTSSPYLTNKVWGSTNNAAGYVTISL